MFPGTVACGERSVDTKKNYVDILNFGTFQKHIVFTGDGENAEIRR